MKKIILFTVIIIFIPFVIVSFFKIDKKEEINNKLNFLIKNNKLDSFVSITYFVSDTKKDGGKYFKYTGKIKKIDIVNKKIILNNSKIINIYDIINISSKVLR